MMFIITRIYKLSKNKYNYTNKKNIQKITHIWICSFYNNILKYSI